MLFPYIRDGFYFLAFLLLSPLLLYRVVVHRRYRRGWLERLGFVRRRFSQQGCIWIHGVSMGEINAIRTLVKRLEEVLPQYEIIISTTTDTGMEQAKKLYGQTHRVFFFPWDFSWAVGRSLARLHPDLCIMMEGEVWPNFTALAAKRGIPVIVANGRVGSSKGWPRYKKVAPLVRPMFRRLSLVLAQDSVSAERFEFLGVPSDRIRVAGTLKYDTAELADRVAGTDELAAAMQWKDSYRLWVAGQTGPGEEVIILNVYERLCRKPGYRDLRLAIVPRKPERFDEVANLITKRNLALVRYSRIKQPPSEPLDEKAIILGDTMGDLRKFYSLAQAVFVGRSLVPMGGSDMMEVAALGRGVITGPYTGNFTETVEALQAGGGIEIVRDEQELTAVLEKILGNSELRRVLGDHARHVIVSNQGATERSTRAITALLGYDYPCHPGDIAVKAYTENV